MTPTSTKKGAKLYRYYVSMDVIRNRETGEETASMRLAAGMVEDAVVTEVRRILQTPEVVTKVITVLKQQDSAVSEADAIAALHEFSALWAQLFPAEQARIIQLLVRASLSPPRGSRSTSGARGSQASSARCSHRAISRPPNDGRQ